jgi:excinuclease ABC subunit B
MRKAIEETNRRRRIQMDYNATHGITPQTIVKPVEMSLAAIAEADYVTVALEPEEEEVVALTAEQREQLIAELEQRMREAARRFEFEKAAQLRDRIKELKRGEILVGGVETVPEQAPISEI